MKNLDEVQLRAAQEIINAGLTNAAKSLSFFIKETLSFDNVILRSDAFDTSFQLTDKGGDEVHLLVTEVMGDLKGVCYLVFSEAEATQLKKTALPADIQNNLERAAAMGDAVMLEIDNIIAASVITQFSNFLKVKIYGGVPSLKKMKFSELKSHLDKCPRTKTFTINFKVSLYADNLNFRPEFLWLFHEDFFQYVKKFCEDKANLQKLSL